ncbi:MAG: tRNA (adenosine(37)-N6)-threonylcarbamoyltransferase complex ATPase subunit type 1 TsaE [Bacteroidetes bacterium]|nr:tRNA (adenosine(37)-N6)-threonylcarbamoyltransferase complex ATPase subunit type 1 TsaE [Bacteroidota bacterium]
MSTYSINSIAELAPVVDEILSLINKHSIFCFYGNLGAGKTTLIKLLCEKLKVMDNISSPTYPIINEYKTEDNNTIYHIDLYRLKSLEEAINIGLEDYLFSNNLCFIEWPDNFETLFPNAVIKIKITKLDEDKRTIEISH